MKTIFKPLLFAILVIAGLRGFAQCVSPNFNYTISPGGQVIFYDHSTLDTANGGGPVANYTWYFGDGSDTVNNNSFQVNYTYGASGTYTVTLRVSSSGCGDST